MPEGGKPIIMIGPDNADLHVSREIIEPSEDLIIIPKTKLGWIVHGPVESSKKVDGFHNPAVTVLSNYQRREIKEERSMKIATSSIKKYRKKIRNSTNLDVG